MSRAPPAALTVETVEAVDAGVPETGSGDQLLSPGNRAGERRSRHPGPLWVALSNLWRNWVSRPGLACPLAWISAGRRGPGDGSGGSAGCPDAWGRRPSARPALPGPCLIDPDDVRRAGLLAARAVQPVLCPRRESGGRRPRPARAWRAVGRKPVVPECSRKGPQRDWRGGPAAALAGTDSAKAVVCGRQSLAVPSRRPRQRPGAGEVVGQVSRHRDGCRHGRTLSAGCFARFAGLGGSPGRAWSRQDPPNRTLKKGEVHSTPPPAQGSVAAGGSPGRWPGGGINP